MIISLLNFKVLSARGRFVALSNALFFTCLVTTTLIAENIFPPSLYLGLQKSAFAMPFMGDLVLTALYIFLVNVVLSAFIIITLPGLVFFPLSSALLLFRAVVWGLLMYNLPTEIFLAAIPTVVFEGEGYCLAATAGTLAGVSWINPRWVYEKENITRLEAFKKAVRECLTIYVYAIILFVVGAIVETVTLAMISH